MCTVQCTVFLYMYMYITIAGHKQHGILVEEINGCLNSAADQLQIDDFREDQRQALKYFLQGHDVFVNLPTGYGKSAVFHFCSFTSDLIVAGRTLAPAHSDQKS